MAHLALDDRFAVCPVRGQYLVSDRVIEPLHHAAAAKELFKLFIEFARRSAKLIQVDRWQVGRSVAQL